MALSAATGLAMLVPIFVQAPGQAEALFSVFGLMLAAGAMASLFLVLRGEYRLRRLLAGPAENIGAGALMFRPGQGLCPICAESGAEATLCCAKCETAYHEACWGYAGQCAVYGCGGKESKAGTGPVA